MKEVHPGQKFEMLTVVDRDYSYEQRLRDEGRQVRPYYRCRCECGKYTTVLVYSLLNGKTRSCGCFKRAMASNMGKHRALDLSGRTFDHLMVLRRDTSVPTGDGRHTYWICKCLKCGNEKSVRGTDLIDGKAVDCGCGYWLRNRVFLRNDLTGRQFGHLKVVNRDLSIGPKSGQHARWICECDICGGSESISSDLLLYGRDRCKNCIGIPLGEARITEILDNLNIEYMHDTASLGCCFPETGGYLRFDFLVKRDDTPYIIEYDGVQHFREIPHWESKIDFEGRKRRDLFKNEWCKERGIPLIRIPYTHLNEITVEDLLPETSAFLLI